MQRVVSVVAHCNIDLHSLHFHHIYLQGIVFEEQDAVQASVRDSVQAHVELRFDGTGVSMS